MTMHEDTTFDAPGVGGGISRRDMLRKSAVVGGAGALMWAAPSITKYGSAAFGETEGTPLGKDFSYIALRYQCDPNGTVYSIKFEFAEGTKCSDGTFQSGNYCVEECETGDFRTPRGQDTDCQFVTADSYSDDCNEAMSRFTITYLDGLKRIRIDLDGDCIIDGVGVGKCGSPESVEEPCKYQDADGQDYIIFDLCGV